LFPAALLARAASGVPAVETYTGGDFVGNTENNPKKTTAAIKYVRSGGT
jgi:hypothetical protein